MVKDNYKPEDASEDVEDDNAVRRIEEEAMLRELVDKGKLDNDEYVRIGPPRASRIYLKDEFETDSRPWRIDDLKSDKRGKGDPERVREVYQDRIDE